MTSDPTGWLVAAWSVMGATLILFLIAMFTLAPWAMVGALVGWPTGYALLAVCQRKMSGAP